MKYLVTFVLLALLLTSVASAGQFDRDRMDVNEGIISNLITSIKAKLGFIPKLLGAGNVFPTTLNNWSSGDTITSAWANTLEDKIGADGSAIITSLDYIVSTLVATTSIPTLDVTSSQVSDFDASVNSYVHSSTTMVKTYVQPTFSVVPKSSVSCAATGELCDYDYVNAQTSAGVSSSTPTLAGKGKLSVTADDVNDPIFVGDNDIRVENYTQVVSTSSDTFVFNGAGYGTTTLSGIPFGTSTVFEFNASSTRPSDEDTVFGVRFNGDDTSTYSWNISILTGGSVATGGAANNDGAVSLQCDNFCSYRLSLVNSTSSVKTVIVSGMTYNSTNDPVHSIIGQFVWKNTTASVNKIEIGPHTHNTVGTSTLRAIVFK